MTWAARCPATTTRPRPECWQEAVQIPPVRMARRRADEDVLAILKANSRLPDSLWGDLNGQLAALELGARADSDDLLQEYGDDTVRAALDTLRQRARRLMLDHVASLPDGEYRYRDTLDNDGVKDAELTIALRLRASGERLELDFRRPPACAGPVNISRATAVAACYVALKHVFPDVPANAGVLDAGDGDAARRPLDLGGTAAPRGRLYRDHPAHDRRDLLRCGSRPRPSARRPRPTAPSTRCPSPATAATRRARGSAGSCSASSAAATAAIARATA